MTQERAIELAIAYVRTQSDLEIQETPICRLIPARYRPELTAANDAWAVSFPDSDTTNSLPHHSPFTILVDVITEAITIPTM